MKRGKCPTSGKEQHSQGSAIKAALSYSRKRGTALRYYRCPSCKSFHLTSKPRWELDNLRVAVTA